jgi:hypothetical protein
MILRDYQRERCYRWQYPYLLLEPIRTEEQLHVAFGHLRSTFKLGQLILQLPPKTRRSATSFGWQLWNEITLHPEHRTYGVLVHEFAHLVIWEWYERRGKDIEPHGPEWLTIFMLLLNKVCGYPLVDLVESAQQERLRFFEDIIGRFRDEEILRAISDGFERQDACLVV